MKRHVLASKEKRFKDNGRVMGDFSGVDALFAYGTLRCPEIVRAVCGQHVVGKAATLENYRVLSLEFRHFSYCGKACATGAASMASFFYSPYLQ